MRSTTSEAFATRLPADESREIEAAIDETNASRAEFLRRAVRYYVAENPDRIETFRPEDPMDRFWTELGCNDA